MGSKHQLLWFLSTIFLQTNVLCFNVTNHFELSHHWLHHEMSPDELSSHFGLLDPAQVDPTSYQVILVNNVYHVQGEVGKHY